MEFEVSETGAPPDTNAHFLSDSAGAPVQLHGLRTTDGQELNFVLCNEAQDATHFIELMVSDEKPSHLRLRAYAK